VQTAYAEAENALVSLDSDRRRVEHLRAAERNAAAAYEAKRIGYSRGFNDIQAALTAESTWRQGRVALAQAQIAAMQRSVQVFKALGGGWSSAAPGVTADQVNKRAG
jgi:outer membrane protein TolC